MTNFAALVPEIPSKFFILHSPEAFTCPVSQLFAAKTFNNLVVAGETSEILPSGLGAPTLALELKSRLTASCCEQSNIVPQSLPTP